MRSSDGGAFRQCMHSYDSAAFVAVGCLIKSRLTSGLDAAEMTSEEIVQRKRQRMAVDESLGDAKDPAKIKQIREEVLCPALQYSNFELAAMTDQLVHSMASSM